MSLELTLGLSIGGSIGLILVLALLKVYVINGRSYDYRPKWPHKVAIVTGANSGIGLETALGLAQAQVNVVFACRSMHKAKQAVDWVKEQLGTGHVPKLVPLELDLSSFKSVEEFAGNFKRDFDRLDIFVQNAGMLNNEVQLTEDGREHQLQANHLGHFYLTNLLMDLVIPKEKSESDPSRIIIVSSEAHNFMRDVESFKKLVEVEFSSDPKAAYVSSKISFLGIQTYGFTKFLNILFGKKLHALYGSKGVFTASLHPGFVRTNIFTSSVSHESGASCALRCLFTALSPIFWYFGKPARNGAATSLYLSLDPEALAYGGEYFDNMILAKKKSPLNSDFELADQIWIRSLESIPQNQKPFPQ